MSFKGKTIFITGASRGIGKAIALRFAREGANIVVAAKSTTEDPKLGGTIYSAAKEIEEAGGQSLAVKCDIRDELHHGSRCAHRAFPGRAFQLARTVFRHCGHGGFAYVAMRRCQCLQIKR